MATEQIFLDTSGFFALLSTTDTHHGIAVQFVQDRKNLFITTDAVISETSTLIKARGAPHLARNLFQMLEQSRALRLIFVESFRFWKSRDYLLKHLDQQFSFVDCSSFIVMKELRLRRALSHDRHFLVAGFVPLLAGDGHG